VTARSRRAVLVACILGSGAVFLDSTIVNVALPAIRREFDAGLSVQQWVVDAYLLTLGALLLLGGSLGDVLGRRRVFVAGLVSFAVASLGCAAAPSAELLVAARALQGVAGALLVPSTLAIIVAIFDESERSAAIGTWTAWTGAATVVGPLAGGALVDAVSWRWVFALNLPVTALALWFISRGTADDEARMPAPRLDLVGATLCALGLGGVVFALIEQPVRGWGDGAVWLPLSVGLVLLAAFPLYERRTHDPMLPLSMFAARNFAVGNVSTFGIYAGLSILFFLNVIFLQGVAGYSALEAGLAMFPVTVIVFFLSRRFGALADRLGPHVFMGGGPLVGAVGIALLLRLDAHPSYLGDVFPALVVFGLGLAMTVAPLTATVLGGAEQSHAGVASGINNAVARVAGLVGIALVGAVVSAQFAASVDDLAQKGLGAPAREALDQAKSRPFVSPSLGAVPAGERDRIASGIEHASLHAYRLGIGFAAGLVAVGGMVSVAGIRNPRRRVAARDCPGGALYGAAKTQVRPSAHARA
jgi:EmrB/QacA subfamily drug resistance transporter